MKVVVLFAFVAVVAADIEFYKTDNDHLDMDAASGEWNSWLTWTALPKEHLVRH